MAKISDVKTFQKFAAFHASVHNHFNIEHHFIGREIFKFNRSTALAVWRQQAA